MKHPLAVALCAVALVGSQKEKTFDALVMTNKKLYEEGASTPYSGNVTGIPYTSMPIFTFDADIMDYDELRPS